MTDGRAPKLAWFWNEPRRVGPCRGPNCGVQLTFLQSVKTGKWMPFTTVTPVETRTQPDDGNNRAPREAVRVDLDEAHWATCPDQRRFGDGRRGRQ